MADGDIKVGFEYLPKNIVDHLSRCVTVRSAIPHVFHVTSITMCLKKEFFRRKFPELDKFTVSSQYHIHRGFLLDESFTKCFDVNQRTFVLHRNKVSITGTLDFVFADENGDVSIFDLKAPKSTFYRERHGAGRGYRRQVQSYLALAHENGALLDVHKAYVLMCAEKVVREEVAEDPEILSWLWDRALRLDYALERGDPSMLEGPEEAWECRPDFCVFRKHCGKEEGKTEEMIERND